jgi:hypothetical protein
VEYIFGWPVKANRDFLEAFFTSAITRLGKGVEI